jgi:hypothetical protein
MNHLTFEGLLARTVSNMSSLNLILAVLILNAVLGLLLGARRGEVGVGAR